MSDLEHVVSVYGRFFAVGFRALYLTPVFSLFFKYLIIFVFFVFFAVGDFCPR